MAGFAAVDDWAESLVDGRSWLASFRKVPGVTTIAGQWLDFSGTAGSPVPNYYASEPLVAADLEGGRGIYHGPDVAPARKYLHRLVMVHGASTATTTTGQNVEMFFLDYLLYYPFIDMDVSGEDQALDNTITLPRYVTGEGVMMMLVAQTATLSGGQFTISYTNQDGTPGRVTPNHFCAAAQPNATLVQAVTAAGGLTPFIALQAGDTGVRSVEAINFSVANGGLAALVLVKPIARFYLREESRRTTSGTLESFGSPVEVEALVSRAGAAQIEDGAYLHFIGRTTAGSASGGSWVGLIETVWG